MPYRPTAQPFMQPYVRSFHFGFARVNRCVTAPQERSRSAPPRDLGASALLNTIMLLTCTAVSGWQLSRSAVPPQPAAASSMAAHSLRTSSLMVVASEGAGAEPEAGKPEIQYRKMGKTEVKLREGKKKSIAKATDTLDMTSAADTFEALCNFAGVPVDREATMDFDGFVLAFEQVFNNGMPMDPDYHDELKALMAKKQARADGTIAMELDEVGMPDWNKFHKLWREQSSMESLLENSLQRKRDEEAAAKREADFAEAIKKATEAAKAAPERPKLMSELLTSREGQGAAELAARHRSMDPTRWAEVVEGVGGLDEPLEQIRRRIWVPLCAPLSLLDELGAERVKGLLLYGPPGCGKSLLGSRLAKGLSRRPPTIVSGPEIMDKYVGNSEAQLRTLFTNPPPVPARPGDAEDAMIAAEAAELHIVVLDEFDAIARKRSGDASGNSEGVAARDSVVNQLLALMDGVAGLPVPTFVIALTNRRELVDSAVLRPGRLEVQVGVGKPDLTGRAAILRIHAEKMRESGRLSLDGEEIGGGEEECSLERVDDAAYDAWIDGLAAATEGFSGAALAAVVRAAVARALDRSSRTNTITACRVSAGDFSNAIADLRASSYELEQDELERAAAAAANDEQQQPPVGERVSEASVQGAQEAP